VYAIDSSYFTLYSAPIGGGAATPLDLTGATAPSNPLGLTIAPADNMLYWTNEYTGTGGWLSRVSGNGGGGGDVTTPHVGTQWPQGIALDTRSGRLYWADRNPNGIRWTTTDGTGSGTISPGTATLPGFSVAVDSTRGRVWWSARTRVASAPIAGGGGADVFTPTGYADGVAIDEAGGMVYWLQSGPGGIGSLLQRGSVSGGTPENLGTTGSGDIGGNTELDLLFAPVASTAPTVSGTAALGAPLTCTGPSWQGDTPGANAFRAPATTSLRWVRDGTVLDAGRAGSLTTDSGGTYTCQAVATNAAGTTVMTSDAITIPAAPTTPSASTPTATPVVTPRVPTLPTRWLLRGRVARATFTPPRTATRFGLTAQAGSRAANTARNEHAVSRRGKCRTIGTGSRRQAACAITLPKGIWTVTVTASRGSTVLARTRRIIRIRP
jgi:hypothetical protein